MRNQLSWIKLIAASSLFFLVSCGGFSGDYKAEKDQDGNEFKTVKIGNQEWMATNLRVTTFRNGEKIPQARTPKEWKSLNKKQIPAWCWRNFNKKTGIKYYNHYAVTDPRGIAPKGWKVPNVKDFQVNISQRSWTGSYGSVWDSKAEEGWGFGNSGNNSTGFSSKPSGYMGYDAVLSNDCCAYYWTTSSYLEDGVKKSNDALNAFYIQFKECDCSDYSYASKECGMPIRCLKK
jgi:uncharacterized protein (TIGR02145 family)